jgi:hypothetical protein
MDNNVVEETIQEVKTEIKSIEYEELEHRFRLMITDSNSLKNGYAILSEVEKYNKFHLNMLQIILTTNNDNLRKLVASSLKIFINKNWNEEVFISYTEKLSFLELLTNNLTTFSDYFMKNFISTLLGIIAQKEQLPIIEQFLKVILVQLKSCQDDILIDSYLRIIFSILNTSDKEIISITGNVIPIIIEVFKTSKQNQKNREKCLKIIIVLFSKLCLEDSYESDIIANHLNEHIENLLSLFISILLSNPKFLFDIKRLTLKVKKID